MAISCGVAGAASWALRRGRAYVFDTKYLTIPHKTSHNPYLEDIAEGRGARSGVVRENAGDMVALYKIWVGREEQIVAELTDALLARRRDVLAPLVDAAVDYEHK
ncbi:hypothetical protein ABZP36_029237 [Zizania latifolia]